MLKVGDEVDVKLLEIDAKTGKMRLSMRALTEKPEGYVEPKGRGGNGGERGPRREGGREGREGGKAPRRDGERREGAPRHEGDRHSDRPRRDDRPRREAPHRNAPAPTIDDYREPVEELY